MHALAQLSLPFLLFLYPARTNSSLSSPLDQGNQPALTASASMNSTALFTNVSSAAPTQFSYIIPYGQTQECDIYGPDCQTGFITLGVDLTTATTTTALPCSDYLTAQSSFILKDIHYPQDYHPFYPLEWQRGFGYSPECTSYAQVWQKGGQYTFSNCGSRNTVVQAAAPSDLGGLPSQVPPGVLRDWQDQYYQCCGNCSLHVSEVRLYYFPDSTAPNCANQTSNSTATVSTGPISKRVHSLAPNGSVATLSGHTLYVGYLLFRYCARAHPNRSTSPSFYLEVVGTAAVTDLCGPVGSTYTNPIIAIPPGQLSTYEVPVYYPVGSEYHDPNGVLGGGFLGSIKPLHAADLACPTWGLGRSTNKDGRVHTTVGPPWLPLVVPPRQVLALDPKWEKICVDYLSYLPGLTSFAIFDPPRALSPVSEMGPTSTKAPVNVPAGPTTIADPPSKATGDPAVPGKSPPASIPDPTIIRDPPGTILPTSKSDPQLPVDPGAPKPSSGIVSPAGPAGPADPPSPIGPAPSANPAAPADPKASITIKESSQDLGGLIFSAFGGIDSGVSENSGKVIEISTPTSGVQAVTIRNGQVLSVGQFGAALDGTTYSAGGPALSISGIVYTVVPTREAEVYTAPSIPGIFTVAGQAVTPNPSGVAIAGSSLSPGGPGIEISNTPISLDPSGNLYVSGKQVPNQPAPSIFTVGDRTFTASPAGFTVDGSAIVPGGRPVTVFNTPISLSPSRVLVIGSSSMSLFSQSILTIGSKAYTASPAGFSIDGKIISPGGPEQTIDGTAVSLGQSGILRIGSKTLSISNPLSTESSNNIYTIGGQVFTANSASFLIGGSPISAGGPAVTIDGTIVSLEASGILDVGTSRIHLSTPRAASSSVFTLDGLTVEAKSSVVVVDGVTLTPGGPGATVDGHNVSLERGGTLDIGTGRFPIPTGLVNGTTSFQAFTGAQRRGFDVSWLSLCGSAVMSLLSISL